MFRVNEEMVVELEILLEIRVGVTIKSDEVCGWGILEL